MVNPKIVDASEIKQRPRKAPATRLIEEVRRQHPTWRTAQDVAEHFDVSIETVRRLGRQRLSDGTPKFKAPSKAARTGDLVVWLYTPVDMKELGEYFGKRYPAATRQGQKRKRS
jgi:hypothetical protein